MDHATVFQLLPYLYLKVVQLRHTLPRGQISVVASGYRSWLNHLQKCRVEWSRVEPIGLCAELWRTYTTHDLHQPARSWA